MCVVVATVAPLRVRVTSISAFSASAATSDFLTQKVFLFGPTMTLLPRIVTDSVPQSLLLFCPSVVVINRILNVSPL